MKLGWSSGVVPGPEPMGNLGSELVLSSESVLNRFSVQMLKAVYLFSYHRLANRFIPPLKVECKAADSQISVTFRSRGQSRYFAWELNTQIPIYFIVQILFKVSSGVSSRGNTALNCVYVSIRLVTSLYNLVITPFPPTTPVERWHGYN